MKKEAFDEYLRVIQSFREKSSSLKFDERVLSENSGSNEIVFTAKNYNLVGGLSQLMHTAGD